ncbi:CHAD domain-containing protein [Oscillatoria salina]|uniref:CHAD domain-containing protein n=1 Tax=Oscillatoria salina TaxID=331517 RepID=UPI001CCD67EE|nr:CHAD domain-containing protein [Oscillatoria salina]MBZ8178689.1 CHAD domain-containing protein [Oscillatoria salina IIICB1]
MSYQFQAEDLTIATGIKRIAAEELESAIAKLKGETEDDPNEAVHDSRKSLKKLRAVLRLVRAEIGEERYQQENVCFRDAGRELSDVRDAQVLIETFDKLIDYFRTYLVPDAFQEIRQNLVTNYEIVSSKILEKEDKTKEVAGILAEAKNRVDCWEIENNNWSALSGGLKKIYKRGSSAFELINEEPSVANFHEWRKQVKYLWYHLRILTPIWADMMTELTSQLKNLSDYLGDDHDLAILRDYFLTKFDQFDNREDLDVLLSLLNRRRPQLQLYAQNLGARIYAEKPKDFVERIGKYWEIWQAEIQPPVKIEIAVKQTVKNKTKLTT